MALKLDFEKVLVKDATTRITNAESLISQTAYEITQKVNQTTYNALEDRVNSAESTITQQADLIQTKVSTTDYTGTTIASKINQSSSTVKVEAQHIKLEGLVTANSNFKVLLDGSVETTGASISGGRHVLNSSGFTLRDSNNNIIVSSANGVANEQNIGRADNVENGYPMKLPFHLGAHVSSINQAILKWDISPFRTYSKGAASGGGTKTTPSGGGSTSGASSRSTTYTTWGSSGIAEATSAVTAGSLPHQHTISLSKLAHNHGMNHTHWMPDHSHSVDITHAHNPVYGILETAVTSNAISIYIDGTYRTGVNASRGEVDLSSWITTNGWHTVELRSTTLKRIDANLFLKTYIRR